MNPLDPRDELAAAQERLVAALVTGGPLPPGFDSEQIAATAQALLRKRAAEVAGTWPGLAAGYGPQWTKTFVEWVADRPPRGSWVDGWDFALAHRDSLPDIAAKELAVLAAQWSYDGTRQPRRRRLPALRRFPGGYAAQLLGRVRLVRARYPRS